MAELEHDETPKVDSYLDLWANNTELFKEAKLGDGRFTVSYAVVGNDELVQVLYGVLDEDRKIDINTASQAVLLRLPGMTSEIADSILDWRPEQSKSGEKLGQVQGKPFRVLEDLFLLEGMSQEAFQSFGAFITAYTDGKVNLNTAPREVLLALKMGEEFADKLGPYRAGPDNLLGTFDDQNFSSLGSAEQQLNTFEALSPQEAAQLTNLVGQNKLKVSSSVFRIQSKGAVGGGKVLRFVEGVLEQSPGPTSAFSLLAWQEN